MNSQAYIPRMVQALDSCVIVDVETTGLEPKDHRIIEVAVLVVEGGQPISTRRWLLNPEVHISEFITDLTGITNAHVADCPTFSDVATEIMETLSPRGDGHTEVAAMAPVDDVGAQSLTERTVTPSEEQPGTKRSEQPHTRESEKSNARTSASRPPILVGHNVAFDYSFLQHELLRHHLAVDADTAMPAAWWSPYTPPLLCTAELSRALIPRQAVGRYRLDNVATYFSTPHRPRHRAEVDVWATFDVLRGLSDIATGKTEHAPKMPAPRGE
ncbi:3'-5' exonuclease [Corynebacterium auriscanis]|uniref:3'-5' exonuclease n=1 Tax=Corynebacterium auriscanis TaxID=99807 RepID=UPI002246CAF8|nr:3'-5' exonuclease [Corynebacterium auriscanis]MCX2163131.1 3'-5' exonuclease [Corynebacterium auriscanis]